MSAAQNLTGKENIYLGIRPYGFHAGNMMPFVVYPLLLCRQMEKLGKQIQFNFYIFINDWEQDKLDGPDPKTYIFNIYPQKTTFQFTYSVEDPSKTVVDYWEPVILKRVNQLKKYYPKITIKAVRNSSMKNHPLMKRCLLKTIEHPELLADVFRKYTDKVVLEQPVQYAMAICPKCHLAKGSTFVRGNNIIHKCENCYQESTGKYQDFEYWFYHKPLAIPRLEIYNIDLCITGADHYSEGDFIVRQKLIDFFNSKAKYPQTLYTPIVLGRNGLVMGKSKNNTETIPLKKLIKLVTNSPFDSTIQIA
ncbi:MAG: hypothetical protein WC596_03920 [Candidatus Shapirobacteria bacterium]